MAPFSFLLDESIGKKNFFFSNNHCENLVELVQVKLKVWGPPCDWVFLEFLTPRLVYTDPPIFHQLQFRFPYLTLVPAEFFPQGILLK